VVIKDVESGDWRIGGNPITASNVKATAANDPCSPLKNTDGNMML